MCILLLAFYIGTFKTVSFVKLSTWLILLGSFIPYVNLGIIVYLAIIYQKWNKVPTRDNKLGRYIEKDRLGCDNFNTITICYAVVASCFFVIFCQIIYLF